MGKITAQIMRSLWRLFGGNFCTITIAKSSKGTIIGLDERTTIDEAFQGSGAVESVTHKIKSPSDVLDFLEQSDPEKYLNESPLNHSGGKS